MSNVALAATIHDPDARFLTIIEHHLPTLQSLFPHIVVAATSVTSASTKRLLLDNQVQITETIVNQIGCSRRTSLALALAFGSPFVLYADFDRMLHWASAYPDELAAALEEVAQYDYLVFGRTQRAFNTHPLTQKETETLTNHVLALALGQKLDVTTGAAAMTRKAAETILVHSTASSNATDTEWPLIVSRFMSGTIGSIAVEGMEFETADFYPDEIAASVSYAAWLEGLSADPRKWLPRLRLTFESVEAMLPFLD